MATQPKTGARLNVRIPAEFKQVIDDAAAAMGQSVSDFAVSTLIETARAVMLARDITELSGRDRDTFVARLDDRTARPNKALRDAAKRYKKQLGR